MVNTSMWDKSDDKICSRFGGEGLGSHCGIEYNFEIDKEY